MKILLIDDNANRGWKQILEKTLTVPDLEIVPSLSFDDALNKVLERYDFIFLDIRMTEEDHKGKNIFETSGYKILKEIKKNFTNINFSTPIILLTASNKIWNIDAFKDYGVDAYYIKEHPNFVFDGETSKQNLDNLQKNFERLIEVGKKRKVIWEYSKDIILKVSSHNYYNGDARYVNIKNRIIDKLKLGYTNLFRCESRLEKKILKINNEAMAFIIYFSMFEELVKSFTDINATWEGHKRKEEWKFRNKEYFIEKISNNSYKINFYKDSKLNKEFKEIEILQDKFDVKRFGDFINLSDQVYSLIYAYRKDNSKTLFDNFKEVNKFRNKMDFTHSSIQNIFKEDLIKQKDLRKTYNKIDDLLRLVNDILKLI
jgi:CheY-like chemotaxis protein